MSRFKFFGLVALGSFVWYFVPGYLFGIVSCLSWVCWVWPNSVYAHQVRYNSHIRYSCSTCGHSELDFPDSTETVGALAQGNREIGRPGGGRYLGDSNPTLFDCRCRILFSFLRLSAP